MMRSIRLTRDIIKVFFIVFDKVIRFNRCSIFLNKAFFDRAFDKNFNNDNEKSFINDDREDNK